MRRAGQGGHLRVAALVALALAAVPAAALAHKGNPDYMSQVRGVSPSVPGLTIEVINRDDSMELVYRGDRTLILEGYNREPYARVSPDGTVAVNRNSPAYYLNQERFAGVEVPPNATPKARPRWRVEQRTGRFQWHDHRMHWMAKDRPPQVKDEEKRTKVFDYTIPLRVEGRRAAIQGTLFWVGRDAGTPVLPFVGLGVLLLLGLAFVLLVRRRRRAQEPPGRPAKPAAEAW